MIVHFLPLFTLQILSLPFTYDCTFSTFIYLVDCTSPLYLSLYIFYLYLPCRLYLSPLPMIVHFLPLFTLQIVPLPFTYDWYIFYLYLPCRLYISPLPMIVHFLPLFTLQIVPLPFTYDCTFSTFIYLVDCTSPLYL